jgi:hypothetical protein
MARTAMPSSFTPRKNSSSNVGQKVFHENSRNTW